MPVPLAHVCVLDISEPWADMPEPAVRGVCVIVSLPSVIGPVVFAKISTERVPGM